MKILMLTTNSSLMDGINRHILMVASSLNRLPDINVAVCTVLPSGDLTHALESGGVQTFSLNAPNGHNWKIVSAFHRIVKNFQPDIIHIHVLALMERLVLATCFRDTKYVVTIHGISDKVESVTTKMKIENFLTKIFAIPLSAKCYISEGVREALSADEDISLKTEVIYNPIVFSHILPQKFTLQKLIGVNDDTPVIGTSCRIANVKNPKAFTDVMCKVLLKNDSVHAVVMGDGDRTLIASCHQIVKQYNLESRFHWLGYRTDAPELVRGMACFVMTSVSEGLPTSLLECMASKTPIAFLKGNGGLKDIASFNNQEGPMAVVAEKEDLDGLAEKISGLLANREQQNEYADRAYEIGKRHFDLNAIIKKLVSLYKQILNEK